MFQRWDILFQNIYVEIKFIIYIAISQPICHYIKNKICVFLMNSEIWLTR